MYIYLIILAIIFTFLISHYINYTKINNTTGIDIQQTEQPVPAVIEKMLNTKLPSIFMYEIELWDGFDLLIGYPYDVISTVFFDNKELIKILKSEYLTPFALPLTKDWTVKLNNLSILWTDIKDKPTKQHNYNHLIANFSGLLMVCLIHPNNDKLISDYKNTEQPFAKYLESNTDFNYLTIPVRPGHVMYIPYGWNYYIYCGQENTTCVYMDLINNTWFG